MTLEVFTACYFADTAPIARCVESCQRLGYKQTLYGRGENWPGLFEGKIVRLLRELENATADVICYADGDSWFLRGPDALQEAFNYYDCDVLVGGERQCFPLGEFASKFDRTAEYPFPNSGNFMGKREALKAVLAAMMKLSPPAHGSNDQAYWLMALPTDRWKVDADCLAFFSTSDDTIEKIISESAQMAWNCATQTYPCLVHFNGGGKDERIREWDRVIGL